MLDASLNSKQAAKKGKGLPKSLVDRVERGLQYLAFLLSESTSTEGAARYASPLVCARPLRAPLTCTCSMPHSPNWHNQLLVPLLVEVAANPTGPFVRIIVKTAASLAVTLPAATKAAACALIDDCADVSEHKCGQHCGQPAGLRFGLTCVVWCVYVAVGV